MKHNFIHYHFHKIVIFIIIFDDAITQHTTNIKGYNNYKTKVHKYDKAIRHIISLKKSFSGDYYYV